jgi:hypothetical protein
MFGFGESRAWEKYDERDDRGVTEEAVTESEYDSGNRDGNTYVHAVPGLHWRPGSRN